jgi:hypothetical protein
MKGYAFVGLFKEQREEQTARRELEKKFKQVRLKDGDKFKLRFLTDEPHSHIKVGCYPNPDMLFQEVEDLPSDLRTLPGKPKAVLVFPVVVESVEWGAKTKAWIAKARAESKTKDPEKLVSEDSLAKSYLDKVSYVTFEGQNAEDVMEKAADFPLTSYSWFYKRKGSEASDTRYLLDHIKEEKVPAKYLKMEQPNFQEIFFPKGKTTALNAKAAAGTESENFEAHAAEFADNFGAEAKDSSTWGE